MNPRSRIVMMTRIPGLLLAVAVAAARTVTQTGRGGIGRARFAWRCILLACAIGGLAGSAAAQIQKADNANTLNLGSSWVGGTAPAAGTVAQWDSTVSAGNCVVGMGTALSWLGISITSPGGPVTIPNTGVVLTLGTSGIDMTSASKDLSIPGGLTLGGNQTWTVNSGRTLTIGALNGTATIIKAGAGTNVLTTAVSARATGAWTLNDGMLKVSAPNALGSAAAVTLALNGGTLDIATDSSVNAHPTTIGGTVTISPDVFTPGVGIAQTLGTLGINGQQLNVSAGGNVTSGTPRLVFGNTTLSVGTSTFDVASGANLTLGIIAGNFNITKQNTGILQLNGTSTRAASTTTLNSGGGTIKITAAAGLGTTAATLQLNGGTLDLAIAAVNAHPTTVGGDTTIISEPLSFGVGITETLGTLSIGANTLTVQAGGNASDGAAGLTFSTSATLSDNAIVNVVNAPTMGTTTMTLPAVTGNTKTLTKNGTGQLTLGSAAVTWSGGLTLNTGTLYLSNATAPGTGKLTINGGVINNTAITLSNNNAEDWNGDFTFAAGAALNTGTGAITLGGNRTVTVSGASVITVPGAIGGGAYSLTKNGFGSLTLSSTTGNGYTGDTTVDGGTLTPTYAGNTSMFSDTARLTLKNATLALAGAGNHTEIVNDSKVGPGASTITGTAAARVLNMNVLSRDVGGTLSLGANSVANTDTSNNGTYGILGGWAVINNTDWAVSAASASDTLIASLGSYTTQNNPASWAANQNVLNSAAWSGTVGGNLTIGSIKCNAASSGTITIGGGVTLTIGTGGILETATVAANLQTITGGTIAGAAGADLVIHQGAAGNLLTIASVIADNTSATALTKSGAGTLTLSGANTYAGGTYLNAGTLKIDNNQALGIGGTLTIQNITTLDAVTSARTLTGIPQVWNGDWIFTGTQSLDMGAGAVTLSGPGVTRMVTANTTTATLTIGGVISGSYGLNKAGTGILLLTGANTYSGDTIISSAAATGPLKLGGATGNVIPNGANKGNVYLTGTAAALDLNGTSETINGLFSSQAGAIVDNTSATTLSTLTVGDNNVSSVFAGVLKNTGAGKLQLVKTGTGTLILSGASTLTGGIALNQGNLVATTLNALGTAANANTVTFGGGNLELRAATTTYTATLNMVNSGGTITLNPAYLLAAVAHTIGPLSIGTQTMAVVGGDNVLSGTPQLTVGATTLTGDPTFNVGTATILVLGAMDGGGPARAITKTGSGALTFGGTSANTYGGLTTVSSGTLNLSKTAGIDAIGSGGLTISGTGNVTLTVANQINDAATVTLSGGTLNMGALSDTVGSLSVTAAS